MTRQLLYVATAAVGLVATASNLRGDELFYHTNTYNGTFSTSNSASFPPAVKFDLPIQSQPYDVTSFGVLSTGDVNPYPANTEIAIRIWDANGVPIYTSSPFDVSGQDSSLAMRYYYLPDIVQVSNSFYAGFQEVNNGFHFEYKVDSPSGNNFGRSYRFKLSDGSKTALTDDLWFNAVVALATPGWTGAAGTNWAASGNWSGAVPGALTGVANADTALFNQNAAHSPLTIDAGRNVQNITFDTGNVNSLTIGTTAGNPLLLTSGGTVQTTSTVANSQTINAPLVLEGNYTFTSGASNGSVTLGFGGGITPAATSGVTTLTLNGGNVGANTLSGILADNGSGRLAVTKSGAGSWTLSGANTNSGNITVSTGALKFNVTSGTPIIGAGVTATVAPGATLELSGSVSALGTAGGNRVHVVNNSTAPGVVVSGTNQVVGGIDGSGNVQVNSGSALTANHIVQNSLIIGGTAASHAIVTIAASDSSGNALADASASPGFVLAGSLLPRAGSPATLGSATDFLSPAFMDAGATKDPTAINSLSDAGAAANLAAVPEPSGIVLLALAMFIGLLARVTNVSRVTNNVKVVGTLRRAVTASARRSVPATLVTVRPRCVVRRALPRFPGSLKNVGRHPFPPLQ